MQHGQVLTVLISALVTVGSPAFGQDDANRSNNQDEARTPVYGWQLMNEQERQSYQEQILLLEDESDRKQFLQSHRSEMQARAEEQGASLAKPQVGQGRGQGKRGKGGNRLRDNRPAFTDFDANADGYLEEMEYARGHAERIAERAREGRAMRSLGNATFADIDADSDGRVNPDEFAAHQGRQHQLNRQRKRQEQGN